MALLTDYIRTLIPANWKSSPSGWTSGNCPMCITNGQSRPDTKSRGGFRFDDDKFQYNCFNCGYTTGWAPGKRISSRLKRLCNQFGADESDIQRLQLELMREDEVSMLMAKQAKRNAPVIIDWAPAQLPEGAEPISEYSGEQTDAYLRAVEYLYNRGFDVSDKRFYYSPASVPGRMKNRIILPFFYKQQVVGYTARWIGNPPEGLPKYFNQQPKNNFVYGLDRQTADKEIVIVTEGQLDAIVTDGVAIGSNNINIDQANIIDSLQKRVIILPDADKAGMEMVKAAIDRGWQVAFPEWDGCKDASDAVKKYGRLFTVKSILESAVSNPTKIQVLAKAYCK